MRRDTARAIILDEKNESVYLLYRKVKRENKFVTYYAIPGGKIEKNETVEEAVKRELKEEFSVKTELLGYLGENKTKNGIDYHFHAKITSGIPTLGGEEKEHNNENNYYEIRKVKIKELSNEKINILPINISYIEKAIKKDYQNHFPNE